MLAPADPAPCLILRLADSPETRELWPHAFELFYKITLMEDEGVQEEAGGGGGQDVQVRRPGPRRAAAGCSRRCGG
jgi:hypothetical protein